ncbi:hypothetical protein FOH10_13570 [Nocardia otitidiscaviarum]|uniref:Uncharacterized protein n=1 Tax=Nocardia otitidiscaviarum TaxID=1823 RepID=A0A516NL04_9NOCA|nr:hypothetical protein [Nocardia otitidiscaviarum]MCP9619093.1 hypothetical protein [Nocardia otitidiscaviarum]QDP79581.1 hypothetical protein FOH10_13570 [Nocardia otitidiscaviarum]
MRKLFATAAVAGTLTAGVAIAGAGAASATPPPPAPQCALVSYPLVLLIEATGGASSLLLPLATSIQSAVCG